ncbi:MAG TPA: protein kinase [Ktedonobacteraceae bacterium]|nr:protein kinase [Ktedonobacteraceae bacterium]
MAEQRTYDALLGVTIGSYRPEQLLGQSKYGPILLARSLENGMPYIMRFLAPPAELAAEARIVYLGLFQQEASRVAMLQHPHILPLHDYGNYHGMPYLVLPNYPTRTLRNQLAKYGPPDALTISRMLDQIAAALAFAHQHAVLHRNLSTESILLDRREKLATTGQEQHGTASNNILVADFGIMRMLELSRQDGQTYRRYGSSESSAPEQIAGMADRPVDTSTDVYALGAVAYRLLTGNPVFTGKTREDIFLQHVQAPVPPLNTLLAGKLLASDPDVMVRMSSLLAKAMAKDPVHRFQHPEELANAFHTLVAPNDMSRKAFVIAVPQPVQPVQNIPAAIPAAPLMLLPRQRQLRRRRINRRTFIAVGGGTVAVAAIAILLGSHYLSGAAGSTVASTGSTGSSTSTPSSTRGAGSTPAPGHSGTVIAHTTDVPLNSAKTFPIANSSNPGILVHLSDNRFVAFNSTCTHAGCAVAYSQQDKLLECPCHQAAFDPAKSAAVVQGPAPTPLAAIAITVNTDGTITTNG